MFILFLVQLLLTIDLFAASKTNHLVFTSSVVDITGAERQNLRYNIDKDLVLPIGLKFDATENVYVGCFENCDREPVVLKKVLTVVGNKVLKTEAQMNELLEFYPFYTKNKENLTLVKTVFSERAHTDEDFRSGSIIYTFKNKSDKFTDVYAEWILGRNTADPEFQAKKKRKDIGYFADFNTRTSGTVIQRFSMKRFPLPVLVIGENLPVEYLRALKESIFNWNDHFKYYFPQGIFQKPIILSSDAFHQEHAFLGNNGGIVINLKARDELNYSGHASNYSDSVTNEIFGARIWMNLPMMERGMDAVFERCIKAQNGLSYDQPWLSLGDCTTSKEGLRTGSYRHTLTHELGHALGLTHNLKGSIGARPGSISSSIMEYPHRAERPFMKVGPYDRDAILWGYFDIEPQENLPYCYDDDSDIWDETFLVKDPQCSGDDRGVDSYAFYESTWIKLIKLGLGGSYSYDDLKGGFTLSLKTFGQYIASAETLGPNHLNFYGLPSRPNDQSEIRTFITQLLEKTLCKQDQGSHFMELLRKQTDEVLNDYSKLKVELSCLK